MHSLVETANMMLSPDYRERFRAEYWQTSLRYEKLHFELIKYEAGLDSKITEDTAVQRNKQASIMEEYLEVLKQIAEVEGINLHVNG